MNLYFDLSKNWLSNLVKTPVLSVVKNRTLNLDVASKGGAKNVISGMKAMFGAGKSNKEKTKEKLMQCKVRVKGLIDVLLSACRATKASTSGGGGGGGKGIPHKLCEFFAKYFVMDGVAFPTGYLWKAEENQLRKRKQFNTLGLTRRMVYKEETMPEDDLDESMDVGGKKKKSWKGRNDDDDGTADLFGANADKIGLLNTESPRILIVNFLICRVLIGQGKYKANAVPQNVVL